MPPGWPDTSRSVGQRQPDVDLGTHPEFAAQFDPAALRVDEMPRDREPQALAGSTPDIGCAPERLERALYHCKKYLDRESNPGYKPAIELKIQQIEQELKK